ncbi:hypothetical protein B9479_008299 [Cryptococcus floricola]|uniref:Uncharacterized protein n=1 Tax=Cryptococcus floricola TaxID=2591691 RepID=A0A5D3ANC3_9TREE|nr:hypothetical protein B9479_008299 [Cryptococcus floricola]
MSVSTPADSNASKDTQSTVFPPDSRVSGVSSTGAKHMCYCVTHLQPGESDEPSWTGGKPIINKTQKCARIHFSDRESTVFEWLCARASIALSFRDDDPAEDEMLWSTLRKSSLERMGLWPKYRDSFKTATKVECGLLKDGEFWNLYEGNPEMEIDRSVMKNIPMFDEAFDVLNSRHRIGDISWTFLPSELQY